MGGKTQTTTQAQTNTPAGLSQLQDIYNRVSQVASTPYAPYTGQLTAGLSGTQQAGISNINAAQGSAQPYFNQAAQYATAGAQPISAGAIQGYQNPYTQQVVDATQNQFNAANQVQQSQLLGNAKAQSGVGGDRLAIAQAELAKNQSLAQNPTIAGLYSNSYNSALGAAQQDRAAQGQAAYTFGALAPSVQNAQLQGANAQLQAGGLEQGTNQAALSAAYNQYLQQLAFPYQQAGFLASAGLPAATSMGGSSTGQTTSPGPNPFVQAAGIGLAGASLFSDRRVKDDVKKIGETHDGLPIYSFRYSGSPYTQIGLMAQDVEKENPEAVGSVGGVKTVDYKKATEDSTKYADGGPVGLFDVQTGIPKFNFAGSSSPYGSAPQLNMSVKPQAAGPFDSISASQLKGGLSGAKNIFSSLMPQTEGGNYDLNMSGMGTPTAEGFLTGGVKRGGRIGYSVGGVIDTVRDPNGIYVPRMADGGVPDFDAAFSPFATPPDNTAANRDLALAMADKYSPEGSIALNAGAPLPRPRPFEAPGTPVGYVPDDGSLPPTSAPTGGTLPAGVLPTPAAAAGAPGAPPTPLTAPAAAAAKANGMGGWNPFNLSDDARMGLVAAGLGTAASKSPFALSAVGEGGLQGVKTYTDAAERKRKAESEASRLLQQANQFAQNLGLHRDQLAETRRAHDTAERRADVAQQRADIPTGFRKTADGGLEPIPNGPADPAHVKATADAKRGSAGLLEDDTISDMAGQYLAGDKSVMQNLGRGQQGAENIVKLRAEISRQAREAGLKPDQIATKMADFAGRTAAMRTLGTRGANVEYAANTANKAIDLAQEAYAKMPRGQFVPFNQLRELYEKKTSSAEQAAAYAATNTLVNEYARVASGGSSTATEGMRQHAREMLNTAQGPEAFNAVLGMMRREIMTAKSAYNETRKEFLEDRGEGGLKETRAPAASGSAPPANPKKGDEFTFKQGVGVFDGTKWVPKP